MRLFLAIWACLASIQLSHAGDIEKTYLTCLETTNSINNSTITACAEKAQTEADKLIAEHVTKFLRKGARQERTTAIKALDEAWATLATKQCQEEAVFIGAPMADKCRVRLLDVKVQHYQTLADESTGEERLCLNPPANDMAKGCYERSVVWVSGANKLELWQPESEWRGAWQQGDESKSAAALTFTDGQKTSILANWCVNACVTVGGAPLQVPVFENNGRLLIWLLDLSNGSRHGPAGDVIEVNISSGASTTLAKALHTPWALSPKQLISKQDIMMCPYYVLQTNIFLYPQDASTPGEVVVVRLPQPIAIEADCAIPKLSPDSTVQERIQAIKRLPLGLPTPDLAGSLSVFELSGDGPAFEVPEAGGTFLRLTTDKTQGQM